MSLLDTLDGIICFDGNRIQGHLILEFYHKRGIMRYYKFYHEDSMFYCIASNISRENFEWNTIENNGKTEILRMHPDFALDFLSRDIKNYEKIYKQILVPKRFKTLKRESKGPYTLGSMIG